MLFFLCILGIAEIIYGLLISFSIIVPYSIRVSLNDKDQKNWKKYHGAAKICWGFAFIFFTLWGFKIGYNLLNITLAIVGLIIGLIAIFKIKN